MNEDNPVTTIRERVACLAGRRLLKRLSVEAEVSYTWVQRFASGDYENPGILTLRRIESALDSIETAA